MRLLLFDIDGTLIISNQAGRMALVHALEEVFGTAGPADSYLMAGKTDPMIISELLRAAGLTAGDIDGGLQRVYELMAEKGRTIFKERGVQPCPGVPALLEALRARDDVVLGLVTGNISLTAPLKLAAAGIDPEQFQLGAYGSDEKDRNLLPALAMERATVCTGYSFDGANTTVIGDTPADILCARAAGARAIAVASGSYSAETLMEYNPDHLLESLIDTRAVLDLLLEGGKERENG